MTMRESVCDNILDVPAGQWIPACAGMTKSVSGVRCGYDEERMWEISKINTI